MIAIKSSEELATLIAALAADIGRAHDYWRLRCKLLEAFAKHPLVQPQSNTFWSMTLTALDSGAILHLCRAFDQDKSSLHLHSWLRTIQSNLRLFSDTEFRQRKAGNPFVDALAADPRLPDPHVLKKDIFECSDHDPLVERLIIYRGSALAHRSAKLALARAARAGQPALTFEDIPLLLKRANVVLNRYSNLFAAEYYSQNTIGQDDYVFVIKSIDSEVKRLRSVRSRRVTNSRPLSSRSVRGRA